MSYPSLRHQTDELRAGDLVELRGPSGANSPGMRLATAGRCSSWRVAPARSVSGRPATDMIRIAHLREEVVLDMRGAVFLRLRVDG